MANGAGEDDGGGGGGGGEAAGLRGGEVPVESAGTKGSGLSWNGIFTWSRNAATEEEEEEEEDDDEPWSWKHDTKRAADAKIAALVILSSLGASRVRAAQEEDRRRLMASRGRGRGRRRRRGRAPCRDRESTPHPYPRLGGFATPRGASEVSLDRGRKLLGEPEDEEEEREDVVDHSHDSCGGVVDDGNVQPTQRKRPLQRQDCGKSGFVAFDMRHPPSNRRKLYPPFYGEVAPDAQPKSEATLSESPSWTLRRLSEGLSLFTRQPKTTATIANSFNNGDRQRTSDAQPASAMHVPRLKSPPSLNLCRGGNDTDSGEVLNESITLGPESSDERLTDQSGGVSSAQRQAIHEQQDCREKDEVEGYASQMRDLPSMFDGIFFSPFIRNHYKGKRKQKDRTKIRKMHINFYAPPVLEPRTSSCAYKSSVSAQRCPFGSVDEDGLSQDSGDQCEAYSDSDNLDIIPRSKMLPFPRLPWSKSEPKLQTKSESEQTKSLETVLHHSSVTEPRSTALQIQIALKKIAQKVLRANFNSSEYETECEEVNGKRKGKEKMAGAPQSHMPHKTTKANEKVYDDDEEQKGDSLEWWQVAALRSCAHGEPGPSRPKMLRIRGVVYREKP